MENEKLKIENYLGRLCLVVFTMLTRILTNSSALGKVDSNSESVMYSLSFNNLSQYNVSLASFSEMFILFKKSAVLCACSASHTSAPTAVPLLYNCLDRINSFFSPTINL
jgi:hypothetical protein